MNKKRFSIRDLLIFALSFAMFSLLIRHWDLIISFVFGSF